jgi:hypothetical protein
LSESEFSNAISPVDERRDADDVATGPDVEHVTRKQMSPLDPSRSGSPKIEGVPHLRVTLELIVECIVFSNEA